MGEQVHVGTADLPHGIGWERYFEKLSFIETSVLAKNPAKPSVLTKWRNAAPGPGSFAVVTPGLHVGPAFLDAARILEPSALVFRTPPSFTPSAANRDELRRVFAEVAPADLGIARVWMPEGLWDTRTAVKLAAEMGVAFGCDPSLRDQTREPPEFYATLEVPEVYFRVSGLGRGHRRLPASDLDELAELVEPYERAWVVFATVDSLTDATRFADVVQK